MFARQPAGFAGGALSGSYPSPGLAMPAAVGPYLHDDFVHSAAGHIAVRYGDLFWISSTITTVPTYSSPIPASSREIGVLRQLTSTTINTGGALYLSPQMFFRYPQPGIVWQTKARIATAPDNLEFWSGFASLINGRVRTADVTQFVGVRYNSAASNNLIGVIKNATGETILDLGISFISGAFSSVGFEVTGTFAAPTFTFFVLSEQVSASFPPVYDRRDIGSIVAPATLPTTTLFPIGGGVYTTIAAARGVEIDSWSCGGLCTR